MLVPDPVAPGGERAKLLDFGIAKLAQHSQRRTCSNVIMGTPSYMSPEQCRGASAVDAKTDVYSLGVMLYEMLVGRPPFVGEGVGDTLAMHMFVEPAPIVEVATQIPATIAELVHRLLSKDRTKRPTMDEVVREFAGMIQASGASTVVLSGQTNALREAKNSSHRLLIAGGLIVASGVLVVAGRYGGQTAKLHLTSSPSAASVTTSLTALEAPSQPVIIAKSADREADKPLLDVYGSDPDSAVPPTPVSKPRSSAMTPDAFIHSRETAASTSQVSAHASSHLLVSESKQSHPTVRIPRRSTPKTFSVTTPQTIEPAVPSEALNGTRPRLPIKLPPEADPPALGSPLDFMHRKKDPHD